MQEYFAAVQILGQRLFRCFALALDLAEDHFDPIIQKPIAMLRLNHYPPQENVVDEFHIGNGAHTDYECFTILLQQDGISALQVVNGQGEWIEAPPIPGTFVINVADQMARWTNDLFTSTMHRVVNQGGKDRMSFAFFYGTDYDAEISVFPSCVPENEKPKYEPVISGDYVLSRLNRVYGYDMRKKKQAVASS